VFLMFFSLWRIFGRKKRPQQALNKNTMAPIKNKKVKPLLMASQKARGGPIIQAREICALIMVINIIACRCLRLAYSRAKAKICGLEAEPNPKSVTANVSNTQ